ncbi:MAG: 50S ribosome-binding GTPase, partial [Acidimicrobiia bacterium]|nr:50S ribosome-binding GTPase [Acidimicrobiia bacterium]
VGGTGSGKSSLLNALAGEEISPTGVVRPTTEQPLAWMPANPEPGLVRLLDDLGINERVGHDSFDEVAILDLPDTDSVVESHRQMVERLLPRVDAIIWVLDPEKYNDRLLHRDFLEPLARYSSQFLFVLNQIDRLSPADEKLVVEDLLDTLKADGISDPEFLAVAADPDEGPPIGIARLSRDLRGRFVAKQAVVANAIADLRDARDAVAGSVGLRLEEGTSYDQRWDITAEQVVSALIEPMIGNEEAAEAAGRRTALAAGGGPIAAGVAWFRSRRLSKAAGWAVPEENVRLEAGTHLTRAASTVNEFVTDLSFETGGSFGRALRASAIPEDLELEIGRSVEAAILEIGPFEVAERVRWWRGAGIVQWAVAVALVSAIVWMWADPAALRPGGDIRPVILAAGALVLGWLVRSAVVADGRRVGRRALASHVGRMRTSIRASLDRRVGIPIRTRMRSRAEVAGALAELSLVAAALEASL